MANNSDTRRLSATPSEEGIDLVGNATPSEEGIDLARNQPLERTVTSILMNGELISEYMEKLFGNASIYRIDLESMRPCHPIFAAYKKRLATYDDWPIGNVQTKENMAQAGFYYTGYSDRVVCFHCNLGLKKWLAKDNPIEEHERNRPYCHFLEEFKALQEERPVLTNVTCKVCLEAPLEEMLLPCQHIAVCSNCCNRILVKNKQCPVCRDDIKGVMRVYIQ